MPASPVAVTARAAMSRTRSVAWIAGERVSGGTMVSFVWGACLQGSRPAVTGTPGPGKGSAMGARPPPRPYHQAVARILLAEDDEGIRLPLVRALEREGHQVEAVT